MADSPIIPEVKPVTPPAEPPIEEKKDEYSYEDLHKEPIKEIAENKEEPEVPEPTEEEKAKIAADEKTQADAEAAKKAEEEEGVAPEELAEDISQRIAEKLSPKEKEEVKDKYTEFFERINAEKGREPNWIELSQFIEDQAIIANEKKQEETKKAEDAQREEEKKATESFTEKFNKQIDEELEELYTQGNLTPIKDKSNPSDQGVIERKALFQAMLDTNKQRASEGKDPIVSIARIFYGGHYTKPNAQPAGGEAPVSMGSGTPSGGEGEQEINYMKDVKKPWAFFKRGA